MPNIVDENHIDASLKFKEILATYKNSEDLINIGAYAKGSNPNIDLSISKIDAFNQFLKQRTHEFSNFDESLAKLKEIVK